MLEEETQSFAFVNGALALCTIVERGPFGPPFNLEANILQGNRACQASNAPFFNKSWRLRICPKGSYGKVGTGKNILFEGSGLIFECELSAREG